MTIGQALTEFWGHVKSVDLDAVSAIGTALSAAFAFFALVFVGVQIRQANKSSDIQTLQDFLRGVIEHEKAIADAEEGDERNDAFHNYLNFIEVHAAALHARLFSHVTNEFVREKLHDTIALIETIGPWSERIMEAKTSSTTFKHIFRFMKEERPHIDRVKKALLEEAQAADASETP